MYNSKFCSAIGGRSVGAMRGPECEDRARQLEDTAHLNEKIECLGQVTARGLNRTPRLISLTTRAPLDLASVHALFQQPYRPIYAQVQV
jgi:hypothetical protein